MSRGEEQPMTTAAALREAFDSAFARAPAHDAAAYEDLLALRLAGMPYAIRLASIAGLYVDRRIVPVPSGSATLLGLVGLRGEIVPVHDPGPLLGHEATQDPRWLVLVREASGGVGLAFEALDSFVRVPRDAITDAGGRASPHAAGVVRLDDGVRPMLDVGSVVEAIAENARAEGSRRES